MPGKELDHLRVLEPAHLGLDQYLLRFRERARRQAQRHACRAQRTHLRQPASAPVQAAMQAASHLALPSSLLCAGSAA